MIIIITITITIMIMIMIMIMIIIIIIIITNFFLYKNAGPHTRNEHHYDLFPARIYRPMYE